MPDVSEMWPEMGNSMHVPQQCRAMPLRWPDALALSLVDVQGPDYGNESSPSVFMLMLFTKNCLRVCILIHEIWFRDSLVGPILLIMQWSALENFKLADLHSLTISIKSNSVDWQEEEDRVGGGQNTPPRSFGSGKIIEVTRDSGKESSWIVVMDTVAEVLVKVAS